MGVQALRRKRLKDDQAKLLEALRGLFLAEQSRVQFHMLRLWHVVLTGDKTLPAYSDELGRMIAQQDKYDGRHCSAS